MSDIKVIGLTGQTGAGKTRVADLCRQAGITVIDADQVSRYVVDNDRPLLVELTLAFGVTILNADGTLNRKKLGSIVFGSKGKLERLNKIIFPFIRADVDRRVAELAAGGERLVVLDAPTLFESGGDKTCDAIVVVTAPLDARLNRIVIRDRLTDEEARKRMRSQPDAGFYTERADYIIENDGSEEALEAKALKLTAVLKALAKEAS